MHGGTSYNTASNYNFFYNVINYNFNLVTDKSDIE